MFRKKSAPQEIVDRAQDIKARAADMADGGGEAFKEFASTTRGAAKEFANAAYKAAKDLMETVDDAGDRFEKRVQPRKRGRKLLKATVALGAGVYVMTNEKIRGMITSKLGMGQSEPQPWEAPSSPADITQTPPVTTP